MSVLGVVGAAAGFVIGGPQGAMLGYSLGSGVDALINAPNIEGPRLDDLEVQMANYGAPIPFEYGTNRHAGTIMWPKEIILDEHEQTESAKGGPEQTSYTYSASFAVLICEGPIAGVRRIWANKKIIYDVAAGSTTNQDPAISGLRFYLGTETQEPDPLIEATDGPSPAYLGYAYCVFEDLALADFANRPPQLEFEVLTDGAPELPDAIPMGPSGGDATLDPTTNYVWSVKGVPNSYVDVFVTDVVSGVLVKTIRIVPNQKSSSMGNTIAFLPDFNEMWVVNENGTDIIAINATTYEYGQFNLAYRHPTLGLISNLTWIGLIRYSATHKNVVVATTNVGGALYIFKEGEMIASDVLHLDTGVYSIDAILPLENGDQAILSYQTISIVTIASGATGVVQTFSSGAIGGNARMTYDPDRSRLLVINGSDSKIIIADLLTGDLTEHTIVFPSDLPINTATTLRDALYHKQNDKYYVTAHAAGQNWMLYTINPDTLAVEYYRTYSGPTSLGTMGEVPGETDYFVYVDSGSSTIYRIPLSGRLEPHQVVLGDIVSDICQRAGLSPAEIDVSQLTDLVDGYIVPRQMSARAAIEPLQTAFFFDAVESDDKIKFVKRGAGTPILIPMEDRAARDFGADLPDSLSIVRAQDMELPVQVDVEYADIDADHLVGNQYSRRITKDTKSRVNIQSPVVMNATKAKQVADVSLYRAWLNQTYKFTTTRKWAHVEPTDIVILPTLEASYTARIVSKREQPSGVIEWEAAMEGVEVYTQSGAGAAPTNYVKQSIYAPGATMLNLLDIPILRDEDNNAGFYDAMGGTSASWTGAQLFRSADGGSTYDPVHIISDSATIGTTQSALPDFTDGNIFDEGSSVTVVMQSGTVLQSVTEAQVLNGANLAVIGSPDRWEVIQFKTATLIAPNTYQLSGLLRGRRGTEWATGTHQAGDRFIMAGLTGWNRVVANDVGLARQYKAPAFRMPLSSTPAQTFTNGAVGLKPFAPVDLTGARDGAGNLTLAWNRRTRLATGTLHLPAPLGETSESYSIDIMSGETVLRTLTSSTPSVVYSAADQTADGITPGAAVTANVYQLGAAGRGYPLKGTV